MADQHREAVAGIGITVAVAIAAGGLAMTGYINPSLGWFFFILGIGAALLIAARTWLPDTWPLHFDFGRREAASHGRVASHSESARTPVEKILEDLRAKHGADHARAIVGEAGVRRRRPDSYHARHTTAAPHVIQDRIRRAPNEPPAEHVELLVPREFEELTQKADSRTAEQKARAFQEFGQAARKLVLKLERCKERDRLRGWHWRALETLHRRAKQALIGVPLDRYSEYAEDSSKVRHMVKRREHPGKGGNPFIIGDLRARLAHDGLN